jgi:hypothetical protein
MTAKIEGMRVPEVCAAIVCHCSPSEHHPMLKLAILSSLFASLASCVLTSTQEPGTQPAAPPASRPEAPAPVAPPPAAQPPLDPELDQLLTRLEAAARDFHAFSAKIAYEKRDALLDRRELRTGEILYRIEPDKKAFAVLFDSLTILPAGGGAGRREQRPQHYIFDGRWLAEVNEKDKQFIKREIVPPGKVLDPLKLGEGPFPLPIGQAKADVLARFEVSRIEVPIAGMLKDLKNVDGLRLTPRAGTREARDYQHVEIFYDRDTQLPVGINAVETNDDQKTVKLTDLKRNPELDDKALKKLDIADPDPKKWKVIIEPWRGEPQ